MMGRAVAAMVLLGLPALVLWRAAGRAAPAPTVVSAPAAEPKIGERLAFSEAEWRARLSPEVFRVLREGGTERAFTGALWDHHGDGVYRCAACGAPLFDSHTKFKSGTGWPSFSQPFAAGRVRERIDRGHGVVRTEILCARCGGHLGHVFPDGPPPTGRRYCVNSASLAFQPRP